VVVVGFTASQTGKYNVESIRQINGLTLWLEQLQRAVAETGPLTPRRCGQPWTPPT
jgi:hypothetical protein